MALQSLTGAAALLRQHPILWSVGLVMGLLAVLDVTVPFYGGSFYAEPLALLQLVVVPFLAGGVYGTIKTGRFTPEEFLQSGRTYYFRILLPGLIIAFAGLLTVLLLVVPVALVGTSVTADVASLLLVGVLIPFAFLTFFFDTVAVFEDAKVFESIRRSIEFVVQELWGVVVFYVVSIAMLVALGFAGLIVWSALLADKLEPLTSMNATELQMLMPEDLLGYVGTDGIWITAAIYAAVILVFSTILYAYKASFFRSRHDGMRMPTGEYDEKGRWYKY
jgi:hypothetical protein